VIWIYPEHMFFRGSAQQGQNLTPGSTAKFTNFQNWREDKVGKFIYHKPTTDVASGQMEIKYQITPNLVLPNLTWDIKREVSAAYWGPGTGGLARVISKGAAGWDDDDSHNNDEDLIQNSSLPQIFEIDGPGFDGLPYTNGFRYAEKNKFQDWVEVRIGGKWYVCSPNKYWRSIMHIKYKDAQSGWIEDAGKTNEVVEGTIEGWAGEWSED